MTIEEFVHQTIRRIAEGGYYHEIERILRDAILSLETDNKQEYLNSLQIALEGAVPVSENVSYYYAMMCLRNFSLMQRESKAHLN
ncbi:hypothetical protein [Chitinophaga vietnamensis]|uniref:hypothetical protein n=1 Tax=Chitinophaga vietnamensis TaxID=2593957 RepID=UPI00117796DF|nr:hypothetical protein [Chitinophaga vietnamensis]